MPATRSRKKQQTQLGFTPLLDSSPAKSAHPVATRSRAAAVTILDSPRPRKRAKIQDAPLPTPEASSQPDLQNDEENVKRETTVPPRQTRSFQSRGNVKKNAIDDDRNKPRSSLDAPPSSFDKLLDTYNDSESESPSLSVSPRPAHTEEREERNANRSLKTARATSSGSEDDDTPTLSMSRAYAEDTPTIGEGSASDSDPDIVTATPRRRRQSLMPHDMVDDLEDDDIPITPSKSKKLSRQDQQDLDDDVEDLRSSSPPPAVKPTQSSARKSALDAYKKNREKQQQKHTGKRAARVISDDEDETSDVEEPMYADAEEQEEGYYDEGENDDFIEQDNEHQSGASAIPLEWRLSSAGWSELFPYAVEWMVQKRLNPGFDIDDPVYSLAFRKLGDFAMGMGSSKFHSSVWVGPFSRALRARPTLEERRFRNDGLEHNTCDACNRTNHPATFEFQFKDSPYSKDTLEDVSDDEEADTRDFELPAEETVFYVGKHCAANARTAHALAHWQRHLYDWVVDWLTENNYLTSSAIVKRDRMTTSKRTKAANKIIDLMRDTGVVKGLLKTFKAEIETAQEEQQYSNNRYIQE
ncbi:MAG: hypothetical protein Q9162_002724 [Coniocarpon cinnabarinum]